MSEKKYTLSSDEVKEIDCWLEKFPANQRQSAVISALTLLQKNHNGWLKQAHLDAVAEYLDMPKISVYEVASFYNLFDLEPVGRHKIFICTKISCMLRNSQKLVDHINNKYGVGLGETTKDGKFSFKNAECLAACGGAPAIQVNDEYHENITTESLDKILEGLE